MSTEDAKEILNQSNEQLNKLHSIVKKSIDDEQLIIDNLLHPPKEILSRGQRISDKVARFGGSWNFIMSFGFLLMAWIAYNTLTPGKEHFDPYPFILMNLILSCVAALQAPIIMMSQNRQEEKDRMRNENDYLINMKAELEIRGVHEKLDLLLEDQIRTLYETQAKQMELLEDLVHKLNALSKTKPD